MAKARWNEYFKFAFVRNPWDRLVSLFFYFRGMNESHRWHVGENIEISAYLKKFKDFKDFVREFKESSLRTHFMFDDQWKWICDRKKNVIVDFCGKYENLEQDFRFICNTVGFEPAILPRRNFSKRQSYSIYFDYETRLAVEEIYSIDISLFDYSFENEN